MIHTHKPAYIRGLHTCALCMKKFQNATLQVWLHCTGRNFVRGMLKRGTSCKCSLHLPQRTRANMESQATFEGQQTSEWKSSAIIILQMKTPEHTHKSGRFQGLIAFILERQSWCLRIVRTKMVFVWNCKVRMLLVFFDNT